MTAKYCLTAVWLNEKAEIAEEHKQGVSLFTLCPKFFSYWWLVNTRPDWHHFCWLMILCRRYEKAYLKFSVVEIIMDFRGYLEKRKAWIFGLLWGGTSLARAAAFGLEASSP